MKHNSGTAEEAEALKLDCGDETLVPVLLLRQYSVNVKKNCNFHFKHKLCVSIQMLWGLCFHAHLHYCISIRS